MKRTLLILVAVCVVAVGGWAVWHFMQPSWGGVGRCGSWQVRHVIVLFWKHLLSDRYCTWLVVVSSSRYLARTVR